MADINLTDIFSTVGYHLSNLIGEVRGKRDQEYRAMEGALIKDPSLGDVPKFRSVMKHHGWQDQDFEVLKAHHAVSNIAELLKTVDQTTQRPPQQPGGPVMGSMGGVAGGTGANISPTPSARIALPAAQIPQAPAPTEASPSQTRAQALAGRLPAGGALTVKEPGASLTLRGSGGTGGGTPLDKEYAALREAVLSGDAQRAKSHQARIDTLSQTPEERAQRTAQALEPLRTQAATGADARRAQREQQKEQRKAETERKKPLYTTVEKHTGWGRLQADGTVDGSLHPPAGWTREQAYQAGYVPIDQKHKSSILSWLGITDEPRTQVGEAPAGGGQPPMPAHGSDSPDELERRLMEKYGAGAAAGGG